MGKWIINLSPPAICKALRTQTHVRTQIGIVLSCLCRKSLQMKGRLRNTALPTYRYMRWISEKLVTSLLENSPKSAHSFFKIIQACGPLPLSEAICVSFHELS